MTTLTPWKVSNCKKLRHVCSVIKKWVNDKRNVGVVGQVNNQVFVLGPAQYPKECLLEAKQIPTHVGDLLKKLAIRNKTKPLDFKRVGLENR